MVDYSGDGAWVELYKFTLADTTVKYFTSFHDDIVWSVDSQTYVAAAIRRSTKSRSFNLAPSDITIDMALNDTWFNIDDVKNNKLLDNCTVVIYKVERGTDSNYAEVMSGVVGDVHTTEVALAMKIQDELLSNKRRIPRRRYSAMCEHVFCGSDCGLTLADWKETGTAEAGSDTDTIVDAANRSEAAEYFDGGYVEMTSGNANGEKRQVKAYTVGNIELLVPFTAAVANGDTYDIYPHCQHQFDKCDAVFSNTDNNGAFKNIPKPEEAYT